MAIGWKGLPLRGLVLDGVCIRVLVVWILSGRVGAQRQGGPFLGGVDCGDLHYACDALSSCWRQACPRRAPPWLVFTHTHSGAARRLRGRPFPGGRAGKGPATLRPAGARADEPPGPREHHHQHRVGGGGARGGVHWAAHLPGGTVETAAPRDHHARGHGRGKGTSHSAIRWYG